MTDSTELTCGACTVAIGAHTMTEGCRKWNAPKPKLLRNGATEIARIQIDDRIVVLGDRGEDDHECFHRFATWRVDQNGDTYWGHYFGTRDEAVKDMLDRI
jgi:hypothetical protein